MDVVKHRELIDETAAPHDPPGVLFVGRRLQPTDPVLSLARAFCCRCDRVVCLEHLVVLSPQDRVLCLTCIDAAAETPAARSPDRLRLLAGLGPWPYAAAGGLAFVPEQRRPEPG
ncbi:MAG TPA: hypothetical protein VHE83_19615 [Mycobacteriales bacterium]|nr:hypothetical protein [Mycobacteriales bacterium]